MIDDEETIIARRYRQLRHPVLTKTFGKRLGMPYKVTFFEKSETQDDACLWCSKKSTIEAHYGTAQIRCCASCICHAAKLARLHGKSLSDSEFKKLFGRPRKK